MSNNTMTNQQFNQEHPELLNQKHQSILKSIQDLQEVEKYMFQNLEQLNGQGGDAIAETQAINKINDLSETRIGLFNQLKNVYTSTQSELNDDKNILANQIAMTKMVEGELNNLKQNISIMQQNKDNKLRLVEIGDYEAQRYNVHISIMQYIFIISLIVLIISVLHKQELIPSIVTTAVVVLAISGGSILIIMKLIDLLRRNNMNFKQYDFVGVNNVEMQPGYQTVLQYDEAFFKNLGKDVQGEYNKYKNKASADFSKITNTINNTTQSISGSSSPSTTQALQQATVAISNTINAKPIQPPTVESLANYASAF